MRERCQLANGVLTVESAPGQGTVIHVFLWVRKSPLPLGEG
jgi:signal transduction histidine kinase